MKPSTFLLLKARIVPMSNEPVATMVRTPAGELAFQDYFVRRQQQDEVVGVRFDGIEAAVLDLRTLSPLDKTAILAVTRHCNKVLIVHEDSRTGSIGESIAAIIQEEAFEALDAPVRILGALDTPVPYAPPLEEFFLVSEAEIERAAHRVAAY